MPWILIRGWLPPSESTYWYDRAFREIAWERPNVLIYGNNYLTPRKTQFIGNKGISYSYSSHLHIAKGWPDWFLPLLKKVRSSCNVEFNGCLLNLYRNGLDRMGWHSDNEPELDSDKPISSLSLGASRDFILKRNNSSERHCLSLGNGDLLIMLPECQKDWKHSIPKRLKINKPRINLTFRSYR